MEFAVAVERYLDAAGITPASRRVYRISLTTWAWFLVGRRPPQGPARRGAEPPVLPLALLDDPVAAARLRAALEDRGATADPRTVQRELSVLRGALTWWRAQGWLSGDPLAGQAAPVVRPRPAADDFPLAAVLALRAALREQTLWHLLHETGGRVEHALALDVDHLDLHHRRTRLGRSPELHWGAATSRLLGLLLVGRRSGPVFLTDRRAPAGTPEGDRCPLTGHGRLSYRRAAELFAEATRPLDPQGRGWTLVRLRGGARS